MRKMSLIVRAGLLAALATGLGPRIALANAGECTVACVRGKQTCAAAVLQAKLACKQDCRNARSSGSAGGSFLGCLGACRADFATAKATCKAAFAECHNACIPGGGGGGIPCADQCGPPAHDCAENVRNIAIACGGGCQVTARAAALACQGSAYPFMCLLDVGRALASCLHGCADGAFSGGRTCLDQLHTCLANCGSPAGAFVH